jgi:hypothetical protein
MKYANCGILADAGGGGVVLWVYNTEKHNLMVVLWKMK